MLVQEINAVAAWQYSRWKRPPQYYCSHRKQTANWRRSFLDCSSHCTGNVLKIIFSTDYMDYIISSHTSLLCENCAYFAEKPARQDRLDLPCAATNQRPLTYNRTVHTVTESYELCVGLITPRNGYNHFLQIPRFLCTSAVSHCTKQQGTSNQDSKALVMTQMLCAVLEEVPMVRRG
jgi:hypothetical protein